MTEAPLLYDLDAGVGTITINRVDRRNALSVAVIDALRDTLGAAREDDAVRVVVLTGAGHEAFSAGADVADSFVGAGSGAGSGEGAAQLHDARGGLARVFEDLWSLGKPTIARVRGHALAGGFGLCLACDLVVAADDAVFGAPEIGLGLWPFMITVPLVRSMPPKKALELMLTGRRIGAAEAERIGFVTAVVPPEALDGAVAELAASIAARPAAAIKLGRDAFYAVWDQPAPDALRHLQAMLTIALGTEDAAEGISAFVEKRAPAWKGR